MADLERLLQQLHDNEINAGLQAFYDAGMRVWIGDETNDVVRQNLDLRRQRAPISTPCRARPLGGLIGFHGQ
jgi:hypothetical protein